MHVTQKGSDSTGRTRIVADAAKAGPDGVKRLACAQAFRLSKTRGIPLAEIGRICERNGIKIAGCQLGCFR